MTNKLLPTTVVGSYVQPLWLVNRDILHSIVPPRVRAKEIWRIPSEYLKEAHDAATLVAIRDMERAGVDIISDGEMRRESYSNHFATSLGGVNTEKPAEVPGRSGKPILVPRITGPIVREKPIQTRDVEFLRKHTTRPIKITLPGPFTMTQTAVNEFYDDDEACAMAFAKVVNEEVRELFAAGADVVQLDEPWMQAKPDQAKRYAVKVINRALEGATGTTALHMCFGYAHAVKNKPRGYSFLPELAECSANQISIETAQPDLDLTILNKLPNKNIILGVVNLGNNKIESSSLIAQRIRAALTIISVERLIIAPDCGMKYLKRTTAFGKLKAMAKGAEIVRKELSD